MNDGIRKALLVGFILASVMIFVWYMGWHNYLTLTSIKENKSYLEAIVQRNYWHAVALFVVLYSAVIALAIPGLPPLTMIGGFLFGLIPGSIYATVSATVGSTTSFLLIRYVLSNVIRGKYAAKLERFNEKIVAHGPASYLISLQLMGLIPYFVINTLAALTNVSLFTFVWTTIVGSLPIIVIYTFAGRQLFLVESARDIFSPSIIALLLFLIALAMMPLFLKFSRRVTDLE